jgi:transposase
VDTSDQALRERTPEAKKRRRTIQERREIVEETLLAGASVSRVARRCDVNANQVFHWRKLYREGRLGSSTTTKLLPVTVGEERSIETLESLASRSGTMEIKLPKGMVRVSGNVDVEALRAALECLIG